MQTTTDIFKTIAKPSKGFYKEKGSRFLAFGFPVTDETEIKAILASLRKKYHDARHHCYAYRIGTDPFRYRANDDGEPPGTAGKPLYGQIVSHELTNILIVVVRYFGGTKLGVPGLINAYKTATLLALEGAGTKTRVVEVWYNVEFGYQQMNDVMKILKDLSATIVSQDFNEVFRVSFSIRESKGEEVRTRLSRLNNISTSIHIYQDHHV